MSRSLAAVGLGETARVTDETTSQSQPVSDFHMHSTGLQASKHIWQLQYHFQECFYYDPKAKLMENVYIVLRYPTRSETKFDYQTIEIMEPKEMSIFLGLS